jgi:hypothetical protein
MSIWDSVTEANKEALRKTWIVAVCFLAGILGVLASCFYEISEILWLFSQYYISQQAKLYIFISYPPWTRVGLDVAVNVKELVAGAKENAVLLTFLVSYFGMYLLIFFIQLVEDWTEGWWIRKHLTVGHYELLFGFYFRFISTPQDTWKRLCSVTRLLVAVIYRPRTWPIIGTVCDCLIMAIDILLWIMTMPHTKLQALYYRSIPDYTYKSLPTEGK